MPTSILVYTAKFPRSRSRHVVYAEDDGGETFRSWCGKEGLRLQHDLVPVGHVTCRKCREAMTLSRLERIGVVHKTR